MSTKQIGDEGEVVSIKYLQSHNYRIITSNYKFGRAGEIDIIATKDGITVFIEVKYRRGISFGKPEESITPAKLHKFKKTIHFYCLKNRIDLEFIRFDVITIMKESVSHKLTHYRNVEI